eukprot:CAMPEP_0204917980 /NCGR_PEP_ID=MMETSP1397-20131031/15693_1 /ASSEMBLY_ACC=CAM_ASM_000891 /TAXON_ID=49980 /ORGANISM="Climacostomum Climacostomum virens, Strain Stock W-24" /LENGTH=634 /DNA_ID=CAMNT_0052091029 /DNA_START=689 /DNA_END=2595 /DNA_ORIENTATION=+
MAMLIGASTGFLPGAVRLIDSDMRERVVNTLVLIISKKKIARKLNPSCGHRNSSASVTASFLEVEEDMPLAMMSKRNYAGLFRSLAAKFIIDSLISLSILHKLKSNQFEITGVKIVKSPRYKTYDITAKTITCVYGTLTSNSLFEFYGSCYKLIEYEEENFATVAKSGRFDVMKIIDSLDPVNNIENINSISGTYGGRSGSFIYRTFDKFFIVKTVTPEEKRTFLNLLLPHYVKRIGEGNTQFVRVLGIYMLCINHYSINLMIMENVLIPQASLLMKFDLKGSKFQRQVLKQPNEALSISKITLKDVDFQNIYKSLKLSDEDAERLMFRLEGDVRMLESLGMMDYSLLVAVYYEHEETDYGSPYFYRKKSSEGLSYRIALIDITQAYDFTKRSENCLKRTLIRVPPDELSSVSPDQYASRFLTACRTILVSTLLCTLGNSADLATRCQCTLYGKYACTSGALESVHLLYNCPSRWSKFRRGVQLRAGTSSPFLDLLVDPPVFAVGYNYRVQPRRAQQTNQVKQQPCACLHEGHEQVLVTSCLLRTEAVIANSVDEASEYVPQQQVGSANHQDQVAKEVSYAFATTSDADGHDGDGVPGYSKGHAHSKIPQLQEVCHHVYGPPILPAHDDICVPV